MQHQWGIQNQLRAHLELTAFSQIYAIGPHVIFMQDLDDSGLKPTLDVGFNILRKVGYDDWSALIMRPAGTSTASAADYKAPERGKIAAQGFTIIANVGDQPSDLAGGNAERVYLVPNPFYRIP